MNKNKDFFKKESHKTYVLRGKIVRALNKKDRKIKCRKCGKLIDPFYIEIHHKVPILSGGKTEPSNIIYLCKTCHGREHGKLQDVPDLIEEIKRIKEIKDAYKLSYEDISKSLSVSFQSVYRWCIGKYEPSKLARMQLKKFIKKYNNSTPLTGEKSGVE